MNNNLQIEKYFLSKNLDVSFNTIGSNETLINLFIKENKDIVQDVAQSNHVKYQCYNRYYKIEPRTKFTGFENYQKLDNQLRLKMSQHVKGLQGAIESKTENINYIFGSYLTELKNSFKKFKNPLLYLSGGIDSEFVALAMLDANVKFTPIIFQWVDDYDKIHNIHDITYALDFCLTHNLNPIIRKVNIEKLWNNLEFELLAKETNISSPQINTYVYMIESTALEYKDSTHILGGEVRFKTQYDVIDNKFNNFVLAAKVPSLGYSGLTYTNTQNVNYTGVNTKNLRLQLKYNWDGNYSNSQTWQINGYVGVDLPSSNFGTANTVTGGPTTGNWFAGPDLPGGTGFDISIDGGTTWPISFIPGTGSVVTLVDKFTQATGPDSTSSTTSYTIKLRSKNDPGNIVTSTITFTNTYIYTPTIAIYTPGGPVSWVTPDPLINKASVATVGAGGGGGSARRVGNGQGENWAAAGGGGGGGNFYAIENVQLGMPGQLTVNFTIGLGGAGGDGFTNTNGGDGGTTTAEMTGGVASVTIYSNGGYGGQKNSTADPNFGQFGAGGNAGLTFSGSSGNNLGNTIDAAFGGGGGGSGGNGTDPIGGGAGTLYFIRNGFPYSALCGKGGDGGSADGPGSGNGNGLSGLTYGDGGGGGGVIANNVDTAFASGGNGASGAVMIYY